MSPIAPGSADKHSANSCVLLHAANLLLSSRRSTFTHRAELVRRPSGLLFTSESGNPRRSNLASRWTVPPTARDRGPSPPRLRAEGAAELSNSRRVDGGGSLGVVPESLTQRPLGQLRGFLPIEQRKIDVSQRHNQ